MNLPLHFVKHGACSKNEYLMVVLHGRGDSPQGFEWMPRTLNIAGLSYLMLQAPDEYYDGYSWYDLAPNQLPGILRSREKLEEVFTELVRAGFQTEKVFLFGFSQGCLMTLEFGARYPHSLAGCIGISGYCYDPKALIAEASIEGKNGDWLITHGTQDDVLPVETTEAQMHELIAANFKIEYREYQKVHTIDDELELPFLREWIRLRMS